MTKLEIIQRGSLKDFLAYNKEYDNSISMKLFEARKFNIEAVKIWLSVRDKLQFIERSAEGDWRTLEIVDSRSKYGINYIFIDVKNKKWRISITASEFYGSTPPPFKEEELD